MQKPKLFDTHKSFVGTVFFLVIIIVVRLFFEYQAYEEFIQKPFYFTHAKVLNAYVKTKKIKSYTVLKLRSDEGFTFYTTSHKNENFIHKSVRIEIFPNKKISFFHYLGVFYIKSRIKKSKELPYTFKDKCLNCVAQQHTNSEIQSFYNAIFFATPIVKSLRKRISLLGVSHLVALSGFHLAILWGLVYGFLMLFYKPVQQKIFPYRHALLDVGFLTILILGIYLWFVGFPPSLLRSYAMMFLGWIILLMGVELLSFTFLVTIILILLVIFPSLLVSLSFWFSVLGVFYIFLILQYSKAYNKWVISLFFIPVGIFILMLPIVHTIFAVTSIYQLLSAVLSLLFIPFYPLAIVLHLIGLGSFFDTLLLWLFHLPKESTTNLLPWWLAMFYIGLSIVSIWYKRFFYVLLGISGVYGIYLFI